MDPETWKVRIAEELKHGFEDRNDYVSASLLSLYWAEADNEGYKEEAERVVQFFAAMGFTTATFAIPSKNSHIELLTRIIQLIKNQDRPGNLIVIHYGGHGDADSDRRMDRESKAVWAAQLKGGPTIDWYEIQPNLHKSQADFLLLLDCCFSAQAARCRAREDPGKCELLAACAMRLQTPGPGPLSFTTALLREMQEMLDNRGKVITSQLAHRLTHQRADLRQTAIYVDMSLGHEGRCIRWKPFNNFKLHENPSARTSQLNIRVAVSEDQHSPENTLHTLVQWLKIEAPSIVREIAVDDIVLRTEELQKFVTGQDSLVDNAPLIDSMSLTEKQDILDVWQEINSQLAEISQSWIPIDQICSAEQASRLKHKFFRFIQELELRNSAMAHKIETEVLAMSPDAVKNIADSSSAKVLGFGAPLRFRSLIKASERTSGSLEIDVDNIQLDEDSAGSTGANRTVAKEVVNQSQVLVEYKAYEEVKGHSEKIQEGRRIARLAQILNCDIPETYLSLKCLHWFHDSYERHYGLVFEIPSAFSLPLITLSELLRPLHRKFRPTLGQRFRIAHKIGLAIRKWHSVGWFHEEICSRNVLVFRDSKDQGYDFLNPFLGGFQYSRREMDFSKGRVVESFKSNVYRHPERQDVPTERHAELHDIYAYGVLLLEIGLWQPVTEHRYLQGISEGREESTPEHMRALLVKIAKQSLAHNMGANYRDAVVACLEDGLKSVVGGSVAHSNLARALEAQVLEEIAKGLVLQ